MILLLFSFLTQMHMLIFLLIVLKYMSDKTAFLLYFKHGETANPSYLQKKGQFSLNNRQHGHGNCHVNNSGGKKQSNYPCQTAVTRASRVTPQSLYTDSKIGRGIKLNHYTPLIPWQAWETRG